MRRGASALAALALWACASLASAYTHPEELVTLRALREAVRALGPAGASLARETWREEEDPCADATGTGWGAWRHVACRTSAGAPAGRVTNVHLADLALEGPAPFRELCAFAHLRELHLDGNALTGPLPTWALACWPNLRELDLSRTPLGGTLPGPSLAAASALQELKLRRANLRGTLPPELADAPALRIVSLEGNALAGTIPPSYATGALARTVQQLDLQDNPAVVGPVPKFPPLRYVCCWCHRRPCGVYLRGTAVDAADDPVARWGLERTAPEPAREPRCPRKARSDPPPYDVWELERRGVLVLDESMRGDPGDLPPPDGSACEARAARGGCDAVRDAGFCQATCAPWGV